jgi:hypothetical protein
MTTASTCFNTSAPRLNPVSVLRRVLCAAGEALAGAWSGLQSVSRASMLDAARGAGGTSTRMRRL